MSHTVYIDEPSVARTAKLLDLLPKEVISQLARDLGVPPGDQSVTICRLLKERRGKFTVSARIDVKV